MTYNASIDCGGSMEEKKKLMDLAQYLKKRDLDIAIIQGVSGMVGQDPIFQLFKKQAGFEFGDHFDYNRESKSMLVLSKEPYDIEDHEEMLNFHHCFKHLHYPQYDLAVFPIHMTPTNTNDRDFETDFVEEIIASAEAGRILLAGTFNALAPEFCLEVTESFFNHGNHIYKYCTESKAICYHPINRMNAKWQDAFHAPHLKQEGKCFTVPTESSKNPSFFYPMRLDYIFMSHSLTPHIESCQTIYDETTHTLAEHYPVEVVMSKI